MRSLGHALLWIGFLAAAFVSLARLEQPDKWSTISWTQYAVAMAVGIVGVALLRYLDRHDDNDDQKTEAEFTVLQQSLTKVSAIVERLSGQASHLPSEVLRCIDDECALPLAEFADARQAMIKRFGMAVYADVMTEFAAAERYINRSWSAAADGYVDEIATSLRRANTHLKTAKDLIQSAESA